MPNPIENQVMVLVKRTGVLRPRDLAAHGISGNISVVSSVEDSFKELDGASTSQARLV
jgi:hypothetical protein